MGRASRKRAAQRAGTYVAPPLPQRPGGRSAPRPRQPFSLAKAKNFIIYGVAVLVAATVALSALPANLQLAGAAIAYFGATGGVIVFRVVQRGWVAMQRRVLIVLLIAAGCTAAGFGLTLMHEPVAQNPLFGILLGILLAGSGRTLFPPEGEAPVTP